jgi:uroporphyrinogen-III decarboxylase
MNEMNSRERVIAALKNQQGDRVPVIPKIWVDFPARVTNTGIRDVIRDPLTALRVIALAGRKIGRIDMQGGLSTHLFDPKDYRIDDPVTIAMGTA